MSPERFWVIDLAKVLAAQIIVLHHLVIYAPFSADLASVWPQMLAWLDIHGRLAVQCFLVMGGWLAHQSLSVQIHTRLGLVLWRRFVRLAVLLWIALILVLLVTKLAGPWLGEMPWVSPLPTLGQFMAHLFFLQDILAIPALSAGVWYVAVDFQLYAISVGLIVLGQRWSNLRAAFHWWLPAVLVLVSAASWTRRPELDMWAVYFYFSYGLGWLASAAGQGRMPRWLFVVMAGAVLGLGVQQEAIRPVLAAMFAAGLLVLRHLLPSAKRPASLGADNASITQHLGWLADRSYALFVSHYALLMVVCAVWIIFELRGPPAALLVVICYLICANGLAVLLFPLGQRLERTILSDWSVRKAQ